MPSFLLPLPVIQHGSMYAQLLGQRRNAGTALHPLHRHLAERDRVLVNSLSSHSQVLSLRSVATARVSLLGFSPSNSEYKAKADGADVIVPNSELISKSVVNWTHTDIHRRTEIAIGAAYGTDPDRVIDILGQIAAANPNVHKQPAPLITFDQFGDSSLNFTLRFWSSLDSWLQVRSELNKQIAREFEENGIEMPFPQRDLHLHMAGTSAEELPVEISTRPATAGLGDNG